MRESLQPGLTGEFEFVVPPTKTVPHLYPEAPEFQAMPEVFATGFMVGLIEWACIQALCPHLDWPREQTVGTHVDLSHTAATPTGFTVKVKVRLVGPCCPGGYGRRRSGSVRMRPGSGVPRRRMILRLSLIHI